MLRDGRMLSAASLRPGQSLMPLYRELIRGYESVYQPLSGHLVPTHRLADEWNIRGGIYADSPGTHRHHIDWDRRNNRPTNIERMAASQHIRLHNEESFGEHFDPQEHGAAISDALLRRRVDPTWNARYCENQSERARKFWTDPQYAAIRSVVCEARRNPDELTRERHRQATTERYRDPQERIRQSHLSAAAWAQDPGVRRERQSEIARAIRIRPEIDAERLHAAFDQAGSIRGAARLLDCDRSVFRRFPETITQFAGRGNMRNHKVVAIRELAGDHDVYCLTVPEAGNFALEAGVFVRNCGIIVNVTPLEPEWEGNVTLEFSNTTPLPAKIYANEGVAQVIFFEADEICAVSYKDRGGKYQGQQGVTLPKT
jgi:dCTP deaminase